MTARMLPFLFLLGGCTAHVSHPSKSVEEMRSDIDLCSDRANHKYWMDPIAALYNAYDCLEAKGYQRNHGDTAARVEKALGENRARRSQERPVGPCQVPCRR
jgi:hypothetical protein